MKTNGTGGGGGWVTVRNVCVECLAISALVVALAGAVYMVSQPIPSILSDEQVIQLSEELQFLKEMWRKGL